MAIDFSQVKSLTIPEGTVTKITIGGVDVWTKPASGKAYRELEYIKFSGAEYIYMGWGAKNKYPKLLTLRINPTPSASKYIFGCYNGSDTDETRRYYLQYNIDNNKGKTRGCIGSKWGSSASTSTVITGTGKFRVFCECFKSGSYWYMKNTLLNATSDVPLNSTSVEQINSQSSNVPTNRELTLGGNNSTGSATPENCISNMYVYKIEEYKTASDQAKSTTTSIFSFPPNCTLNKTYIPAQRKSDGVCGLWCQQDNVFMPMQGTAITSAAAGPIVNENPSWSPTIV